MGDQKGILALLVNAALALEHATQTFFAFGWVLVIFRPWLYDCEKHEGRKWYKGL